MHTVWARSGVPASVKPADLLAVVRLLASEPETVGTAESFVQRLPVEAALAIQVDGPRALPVAGDVRTLDNLSAPIGGARPAAPRETPPTPPTPASPPRPLQPEEPEQYDPLRDVELQADMAYRREDWEELLSIATRILQAEANEKDESRRRRYAVTLRRMLPKSALLNIARTALADARRSDATAVLKRMDADGVEALLELLTAAPTLAERRGYFGILTKMESGTERIVTRLNHPDWFVVRNVAELCGELRLAGAVRSLTGQAAHRDERVRRAVAGALGKIGSPEVLAPLRQLVNDVEPVVRLQAVQGINSPWGRGLAMSIAVRLPDEANADVLRELHLALGRLATPEAVQALRAAAAPGRGLLNRKPVSVRLAAIEGLGLASAPAAKGALQDLLADDDASVREAAARALGRG